jgi:hypothetical protein
MIQLRSDYLVFKTSDGGVPCSAELVAVELMGDSASLLDPEVLQQVAAGVLHYFRDELGRITVSVGEFSEALARVLRGFGFEVTVEDAASPGGHSAAATTPAPAPDRVTETDLRRLAEEAGAAFELTFFPRLRAEVRARLRESPVLLRFTGLRACVKQLAGARRWCLRCQTLSDQINAYLRRCLTEEHRDCALLVR